MNITDQCTVLNNLHSRRDGQMTSKYSIQSGKKLSRFIKFLKKFISVFYVFASCLFMHIISVTFQLIKVNDNPNFILICTNLGYFRFESDVLNDYLLLCKIIYMIRQWYIFPVKFPQSAAYLFAFQGTYHNIMKNSLFFLKGIRYMFPYQHHCNLNDVTILICRLLQSSKYAHET